MKLEPDNVTARLYKVFVHIQNKEYPKALPELDRILKTDPENVQALTYRGVAYLETKAYDQALLALDEVLKLEPGIWPLCATGPSPTCKTIVCQRL